MPFYPKIYETFWGTNVPADNPADFSPVTVANRFIFHTDCWLIGARFYRDLSDDGEHMVWLRDYPAGDIIRVGHFRRVAAAGSGADGWHTTYFPKRLKVNSEDLVDLNVWFQRGQYWRTLDVLNLGNDSNASGRIYMEEDNAFGNRNGRFSYSADLTPNSTFGSSKYGIDPIIWVEGT